MPRRTELARTAEQCARTCEQLAHTLWHRQDVHRRMRQIRLLQDCAFSCRHLHLLLIRNRPEARQEAERCASICERCARECRKFSDPESRHCAEVCTNCARDCQNYVRARSFSYEWDLYSYF
ncbi:hypothetical protein [Thermoactinomyces sp. CICC 10521]|uniref:hypothetical protein n=1 Tax=Thermoactinomyces sp. CICC 10521 TaxID=2767426 RepID=UPI0018DE67D7|nr:hypothetical protein [Thermoactinomyces sp. CICC 10521]MBH8608497.1 hypothetical protein [Thermoactinomyces sp. CICC 10521]